MSFGLNVNNKMNKPPGHQDTKFFPFVPSSLRGEQKMNHEDTRTQSFLLFVVRKNEPPGHQDTKFFSFVPLCLCGK